MITASDVKLLKQFNLTPVACRETGFQSLVDKGLIEKQRGLWVESEKGKTLFKQVMEDHKIITTRVQWLADELLMGDYLHWLAQPQDSLLLDFLPTSWIVGVYRREAEARGLVDGDH
jgi:hypothetical protein